MIQLLHEFLTALFPYRINHIQVYKPAPFIGQEPLDSVKTLKTECHLNRQ